MIPEASSATPIGIFLLADGFLNAGRDTSRTAHTATDGPTRLLSYHACEFFLKACLRQQGEDINTLRGYGHDLRKMLDSAETKGLIPSKRARTAIAQVVDQYDYVRVR